MNISKVAALSGLPAKTIRYYEDIGLVRPRRGPNGYRDFGESDAHKLTFLARARSLGFAIEDCRALLSLYEDRGRASADVKAIAGHHLERIDAKLVELAAMRDTLAHLVDSCRGDGRPACPILDDLAGKNTALYEAGCATRSSSDRASAGGARTSKRQQSQPNRPVMR